MASSPTRWSCDLAPTRRDMAVLVRVHLEQTTAGIPCEFLAGLLIAPAFRLTVFHNLRLCPNEAKR